MTKMEINLEELADSLLEDMARKQRVPLRSLGIMDKNRQATVKRREIPLSSVVGRRNREDS